MKIFLAIIGSLLVLSLSASGQVFLKADLTGGQEVPAVTTTGSGTFWGILDPAGNRTLYWSVSAARTLGQVAVAKLSIGDSGTVGSDVQTISIFNNGSEGTWVGVPDNVIDAMLKGKAYINVITTHDANGEVRGQIHAQSGMVFTFAMAGTHETPPVTTTGRGTGYLLLHPTGSADYQITYTSLSGHATAAHFHIGAQDTAGPVNHGVTVDTTASSGTIKGTWSNVPDSVIGQLTRERIYFNVHTPSHPGGEIRGQLLANISFIFRAYLNGANESPAVADSGRGLAWITLWKPNNSPGPMGPLESRFTYTKFPSADPPLNAQWGIGGNGSAGTIVHSLSYGQGSTASLDDSWGNPPDSVIGALVRGNLFLNMVNIAHPNGAIRGQFQFVENALPFAITMDARYEVPAPTVLTGNGTGFVTIDYQAGTLTHAERVNNLSGPPTLAHFHKGVSGVAGPVVLGISLVDSNDFATITGVADSFMLAMLEGKVYMNVHTHDNPGGEVRGQVYIANSVEAVRQIPNAVPENYQLTQNYPNPFNPTTSFTFQITKADHVTLKVFNVLGQEVATLLDEERPAGAYDVRFDGKALSSGVYFYRLQTGAGFSAMRKMVLMK